MRLLWLIVPFCLLFACEKNTLAPIDQDKGENYIPMDSGLSFVFRVDSIVYNSFNEDPLGDTFSYWTKYLIVENLNLNSEEEIRRVERLISQDSGKTWLYDKNFILSRNSVRAISYESGDPVVEMSFPIALFKRWNGNMFNTKNSQEYIYENVNVSLDVDTANYSQVVQVVRKDVRNQIRIDYNTAYYAPGKGMIQQEIEDITYKDLGQTKADGYRVKYWRID